MIPMHLPFVLRADGGARLGICHVKRCLAWVRALAARIRPVIVIHSLLEECLAGRFGLPVDLAVIPYAGAEDQNIFAPGVRLAPGSDHLPLDHHRHAVAVR